MLVPSLDKVRFCFLASEKHSPHSLSLYSDVSILSTDHTLSKGFYTWVCYFPKLSLPIKTSAVFLFTVSQIPCFPVSQAITIQWKVHNLSTEYHFLFSYKRYYEIKFQMSWMWWLILCVSLLSKGVPRQMKKHDLRVRVFLWDDGIWIARLNKDHPHQCQWKSFNPLRTWKEQKDGRRKNCSVLELGHPSFPVIWHQCSWFILELHWLAWASSYRQKIVELRSLCNHMSQSFIKNSIYLYLFLLSISISISNLYLYLSTSFLILLLYKTLILSFVNLII